jgi:hypothetical protein
MHVSVGSICQTKKGGLANWNSKRWYLVGGIARVDLSTVRNHSRSQMEPSERVALKACLPYPNISKKNTEGLLLCKNGRRS